MSSASVENDAIAWLLTHMPGAKDTRHVRGAPADLEWNGRIIEVKAYSGSARGTEVWLEPAQYDAGMADPRFELWLVEDVVSGPKGMRITVLAGERLARLLARAKEYRYWMLPLPVAEYEAARVAGLAVMTSQFQ